jgi:hypothetical protein
MIPCDVGVVCRIRETASLIFVPPGRAWSSGTVRKPHSALRATSTAFAHVPQVIAGAARRTACASAVNVAAPTASPIAVATARTNLIRDLSCRFAHIVRWQRLFRALPTPGCG